MCFALSKKIQIIMATGSRFFRVVSSIPVLRLHELSRLIMVARHVQDTVSSSSLLKW